MTYPTPQVSPPPRRRRSGWALPAVLGGLLVLGVLLAAGVFSGPLSASRTDGTATAAEASGLDEVLDRTDGVTASFLKELIRRAALFAAERTDDGALDVSAADLTAALDELLDTRNAMTRTLLGAGDRG